jgi:hypothetical protein
MTAAMFNGWWTAVVKCVWLWRRQKLWSIETLSAMNAKVAATYISHQRYTGLASRAEAAAG